MITNKQTRTLPLARFPLVSTSSVEEAEGILGSSLAPCHIQKIADRQRFKLVMNGVSFGSSSVVFNDYGCDAEVAADAPDQSVSFILGGGAPTRFDLSDGSYQVGSGKALVVTNCERMRIHRPVDSELLVLRVSMKDLAAHFERLAERYLRGSLSFHREITLAEGGGEKLSQLMMHVVSALNDDDLVVERASLRRGYDEELLSSLLSLSIEAPAEFSEDGPRIRQVSPAIVKYAEEYMRANLGESVTIADLLKLCNCSRRTLSATFRKTRGYSPMEFLTEQRLIEARRRLQSPGEGDTVSSIAVDCGLAHLGRFSQIYKRRFGEHPSETLRVSKQHPARQGKES